ncbi:concanavalin A-like lectin/glucanase [Sistotremastrum niveocremeum HHB9708]|uniref:Concanavalin A-like lectin/glucanase n=1 Tax=Sistotremastrum niveocremeum HHB9708 TaxID=1314777 RepID=A0A164RL64_9AGAM|nr:concanavalin A-like lectin/glucanase [Sistotremastrum niveocremeum HHB9708]
MKLLSGLVSVAVAVSTVSAQVLTGATTCEPAGGYTLCQNLWGAKAGVGGQNSTLLSATGNTVSWMTNWTWANGPNSVKSYANVQSNSVQGVQLSALTSAPTTWSWEYLSQSDGIRADVSYDIWLGAAPTGAPASAASSYEIMIWLSGLGGIQPVGSQITTGTPIAGTTWNLWSGPNTNWHVYSFVATSQINNFNVDLKAFFDFLVANEGVASSQYIQAIQTGTEPFTGSAVLMISSYSVSAITGTQSSSSSSSSTTSSTSSTSKSTSSSSSSSSSSSKTTTITTTSTTSTSSASGATQTHWGQWYVSSLMRHTVN